MNRMEMITALVMVCTLTMGGCRTTSDSVATLSPDEISLLREWRPMSKSVKESYPEVRILIEHHLTKNDIMNYLHDSVVIDKRNERRNYWYIPVVRSQGVDLRFDSSDRVIEVIPVGPPPEAWMKGRIVEQENPGDK